MKGVQLAKAIALLCDSRSDLDAKLAVVLAKWVKDNVAKGATLDTLRDVARCNGTDVLRWHVDTLSPAEIKTLCKKLDPHRPDLASAPEDQLKSHILSLVRDTSEPSKKVDPPKRPKPMPISEILAIRDPVTRRLELDRHSPAQLKKAVKENSIDAEQLGSKPSKTEIIEHIQAALSAGWPRERSILDINKQ